MEIISEPTSGGHYEDHRRRSLCTAEGVTGCRASQEDMWCSVLHPFLRKALPSSYTVPSTLVSLWNSSFSCLLSHHSSLREVKFLPPTSWQSKVPPTQISNYTLPIFPIAWLFCCCFWSLSLYLTCWSPCVHSEILKDQRFCLVLSCSQPRGNRSPKSIKYCIIYLSLCNILPPNLAVCISLLGFP